MRLDIYVLGNESREDSLARSTRLSEGKVGHTTQDPSRQASLLSLPALSRLEPVGRTA